MAAAAVPAISLGAQWFMNRGANKRINQGLDTATKGLQTSGSDLSKFGDTLASTGAPLLDQSQKSLTQAGGAYNQVGSYLSPILSGSRGAVNQALAPDLAAITETYRGAGKAVEQSGMRGGTRDLANAELNRDRAGKLALLPSQARASAATGMMDVGSGQAGVGATQAGAASNLFGNATAAKQGATGAYGTLFHGANQQQALMQQRTMGSGNAIGSMIFDAVKSKGSKGGGGTGGTPANIPMGAG